MVQMDLKLHLVLVLDIHLLLLLLVVGIEMHRVLLSMLLEMTPTH